MLYAHVLLIDGGGADFMGLKVASPIIKHLIEFQNIQ